MQLAEEKKKSNNNKEQDRENRKKVSSLDPLEEEKKKRKKSGKMPRDSFDDGEKCYCQNGCKHEEIGVELCQKLPLGETSAT